MKRNLLRFAWVVLTSLFVTQGAFSLELKGASSTVVTATSSASSVSLQSGTVVKIDPRSGELVLDGARRFTFTPGGGVTVRHQNGAAASMAEVKVGVSVRLTVISNAGSATSQLNELWIVE